MVHIFLNSQNDTVLFYGDPLVFFGFNLIASIIGGFGFSKMVIWLKKDNEVPKK